MRLPPELKNIILDYFYSNVMFELRQCLHRDLLHCSVICELHVFFLHYPPFLVAET
jgi:hypothetical protein